MGQGGKVSVAKGVQKKRHLQENSVGMLHQFDLHHLEETQKKPGTRRHTVHRSTGQKEVSVGELMAVVANV